MCKHYSNNNITSSNLSQQSSEVDVIIGNEKQNPESRELNKRGMKIE